MSYLPGKGEESQSELVQQLCAPPEALGSVGRPVALQGCGVLPAVTGSTLYKSQLGLDAGYSKYNVSKVRLFFFCRFFQTAHQKTKTK